RLREQFLQTPPECAELALEVLELPDEAHRLLPVERGSAGTQHGEGPPQRLQLVPPLHDDTNICSSRREGKGSRSAPADRSFGSPPLWCGRGGAKVDARFPNDTKPRGGGCTCGPSET